MSKTRINWIDCAKGIAILLVIAGHTIEQPVIRGAIFSFHMPLFFILSCMTYRFATSGSELGAKFLKSCRHLLLPAVIVWAIWTLYVPISAAAHAAPIPDVVTYLRMQLLALIWASGAEVHFGATVIPTIGAPWFFFALCLGRAVYDLLHTKLGDKTTLACSIVLSAIGVWVGTHQWLPLSLDIALAIQPFFYVGERLPKDKLAEHPRRWFLIAATLWAITLGICFLASGHYLELARRRYFMYPLSYATAIFGTLMVLEFCIAIDGESLPYRWLCSLGKSSLYLLCIHSLDGIWAPLFAASNQYLCALLRIAVDLCILFLFMQVKGLIARGGATRARKAG